MATVKVKLCKTK